MSGDDMSTLRAASHHLRSTAGEHIVAGVTTESN